MLQKGNIMRLLLTLLVLCTIGFSQVGLAMPNWVTTGESYNGNYMIDIEVNHDSTEVYFGGLILTQVGYPPNCVYDDEPLLNTMYVMYADGTYFAALYSWNSVGRYWVYIDTWILS